MNFWGSRFFLSPAEVLFTQDSVAMCFQNENELNKTCEEIAKNNLSATDFPNIRVLVEDGKYFSVDNRRLYVFRVLNLLGLLNRIQVKKVNEFDRERTTQNNGCHIFVRNRKVNNRWVRRETYRHCSCVEGRNKRLPSWWNITLKCHVSLVNVRLQRPVLENSSTEEQSSDDKEHKSDTWPEKTVVISSISSSMSNSTNKHKNDNHLYHEITSQAFSFFVTDDSPASASYSDSKVVDESDIISSRVSLNSNCDTESFDHAFRKNSINVFSDVSSKKSNIVQGKHDSTTANLSNNINRNNDEVSINDFSGSFQSEPGSCHSDLPRSEIEDTNVANRKTSSSNVFQSDLWELHGQANAENSIEHKESKNHNLPFLFAQLRNGSCVEGSTNPAFISSCTPHLSSVKNTKDLATPSLFDTDSSSTTNQSSPAVRRHSVSSSVAEKKKHSTSSFEANWLKFGSEFKSTSEIASASVTNFKSSISKSSSSSSSYVSKTDYLDFAHSNSLNSFLSVEDYSSPNNNFSLPTTEHSNFFSVDSGSVASFSSVANESDVMDFYTPGVSDSSNPFADIQELSFPVPIPNTEIFTPVIRQPVHPQTQIRNENVSPHNENAISNETGESCIEFCVKKLFCCCF